MSFPFPNSPSINLQEMHYLIHFLCDIPTLMYVMNLKIYSLLCVCVILLSVGFLFQIILYSELPQETLIGNDTHFLLWWYPFIAGQRVKSCGKHTCIFISNREYINHPNLKGLLFYGSSFNSGDLPLPRKNKLWALFHEESPRNVAVFSHEPVLQLFNYSATISRHSNIPLTLQYLPSLEDLTSTKYLKSTEEKNVFQGTLAPIVYIQSDCSTPNNRDSYIYELMKYIPIDSYGKCLNNKQLPKSLEDPMKTMMSSEIMELISHYKFSIAFENAICEDYITEKLWRPLIAGSLPIYVGSPSIKDWLPNNKSVIFPTEFSSPQRLAEFLWYLNNNSNEYNSFFEHKIKNKIGNINLIKNFKVLWRDNDLGVFEDFECFICNRVNSEEKNIIDKSHYNCPQPVSIVDLKVNKSNWWHDDYLVSACEAKALKRFVEESNDINGKVGSFKKEKIDFRNC